VAIGRTLQWLTAAILKTEKPSYLSSGLADWDEIRHDESNWAS